MGKRKGSMEDMVSQRDDRAMAEQRNSLQTGMTKRTKELMEFYRGRRVMVTGHTGFKGSYMCAVLSMLGAEVHGYALWAPTEPSLFSIMYGMKGGDLYGEEVEAKLRVSQSETAHPPMTIHSHIGDITDLEGLMSYYDLVRPELVIHMAAQPIVRESYVIPRETYEVNVMGTVNLLECIRQIPCCRSFLNVTTDKVYLNEERQGYGYREDDRLDGFDPYSNSKSCSELVTHSYKSSFLEAAGVAVSTARAGNVIGGGDFAKDRILPDFVRAIEKKEALRVRNPYSTRPYQHVLEPIFTYLYLAMAQEKDISRAGWYNVGPDDRDCVTTGELCDMFEKAYGEGASWVSAAEEGSPHEASFLKLDNSKLKERMGLSPAWHINEAVEATADWTRAWLSGGSSSANECLLSQIQSFMQLF